MPGLNRVSLIGHLGGDPEMRYTPDGKPVTDFSLAVTNKYGQNEDTTWFRVISWSSLAELVNQYLHKGSLAFVEGRLRTRKWEAKDGQQRMSLEVIADRVLFLDRKAQEAVAEEPASVGAEEPASVGAEEPASVGAEDAES